MEKHKFPSAGKTAFAWWMVSVMEPVRERAVAGITMDVTVAAMVHGAVLNMGPVMEITRSSLEDPLNAIPEVIMGGDIVDVLPEGRCL